MPRNRLSRFLNRVYVLSAICGMLPSLAFAQQGARIAPCNCADLESLQHRLEEVTALKSLLQEKLLAASATEIASRLRWQNLEGELKNHLQTLKYQHPTTPATAAMLNNNLDPSCAAQAQSFGACLDRDWAAHQQAHEQSCLAGRWDWQNVWTIRDALQEEINADQAEIEFLQAEIALLSCQCPHFMILVQVITTTSVSGPLTERSGRSLNGMNGIRIPIVLHDDGTFEGFGSGSDAGTARGQAGPDLVTSQFGNQVFIRATGKIQPGDCITRPCRPDMMHLVLAGATSRQTNQAHATAPGVNITIHDTTPGGQGVEVFDLPAYVGASAQRTFLATGMINSQMTVMIAPASSSQPGGAASVAGASLLYSVMECRLSAVLSPGGEPGGPPEGGGAGSGGGAGGGGGGGGGSRGSVGPAQNAALIDIKETIHTVDSVPFPPNLPHVVIAVNEPVQISDVVSQPVAIDVVEKIHTTDSAQWPVVIVVAENVQVGDTVLPSMSLNIVESIQVNDAATYPP